MQRDPPPSLRCQTNRLAVNQSAHSLRGRTARAFRRCGALRSTRPTRLPSQMGTPLTHSRLHPDDGKALVALDRDRSAVGLRPVSLIRRITDVGLNSVDSPSRNCLEGSSATSPLRSTRRTSRRCELEPSRALFRLGEPRLASWDARDHPDQRRLASALADATSVLGPSLATASGPLALRLDVGLPSTVPLLDAHDLDNYLYIPWLST